MIHPHLVLHLGAPKCGSSALQAALTAHPDHKAAKDGLFLRYVACRVRGATTRPIYGRSLQTLGRRSVHGYLCWPNFAPRIAEAPVFEAIEAVTARGQRRGHIPVLSCEGWVAHPERFANALARWGNPPVEAVVYLRPQLDWINAAWWQWGIWGAPSLTAWLNRGDMVYRFGLLLETWAAIPNLRLRIRPSTQDVVADFAALYRLDLPVPAVRNQSLPPSLIGFLLRNRRFRKTAHDTAAEFVFQRWCPSVDQLPLWAVQVPHVHRLRPLAFETQTRIAALSDGDARAAFDADPRWHSEKPYHPAILAGPSRLHAVEDLPALYDALAAGLSAAARALGREERPLPGKPLPEASLEAWDAVLSDMISWLIAQDALWRTGRISQLAGRLRRPFRTDSADRGDGGAAM